MKNLAIAALAASLALAGCSTAQLDDQRVLVVEGQPMNVKVVNIPNMEVEIAPRKAVCDTTTASGQMIKSECLQFRQTHQKNFTSFNGDIQGFSYEPGYRYVLDVRQEAVADEVNGVVKPVWILNDVISKTAE